MRILMYHRFQPAGDVQTLLDEQCRHIKRYYQPISLSEAAEYFGAHSRFPRSAIVVTVDNGTQTTGSGLIT